jgi:hypothetical protein
MNEKKDIKRKLYNCNANIYFIQKCLRNIVSCILIILCKSQPEDGFMKKAETCCYHDFLNYLLNIFYIIKVVSGIKIICIV